MPESVTPNIDRLRELSRQLAALIEDPQPGLYMWRSALADVTDRLRSCPLSDDLTFQQLRIANRARTEQVFHAIDQWTPSEWACAMAGECGEACNEIKKMHRGDGDPSGGFAAAEIADMVIYADLLCQRLGIHLDDAIQRKFNRTSEKMKSTVRL